MIVITGAAGFIGSCIVAKLNERGEENLILVDHLDDKQKERNLENKKYSQYYDKKDFLDQIKQDSFENQIDAVIHMGACSSTTLEDEQYFLENNYEYTRVLAKWALAHSVRFIYASSAATYGDGSKGYGDDDETTKACSPLNLYGESKQKFDQWALDEGIIGKIVGLKFFNVFGPNEYHKGDMRSVVAKAYQRVVDKGEMSLFKSYKDEFGDGEQKRDFIYIKDAVNVCLFFLDNPQINGIFNVGTGQARTWKDLAAALFSATDKPLQINYVDMPETLRSRYQYFTQAKMDKLRNVGYNKPFTKLEDAVADYVWYLADQRCL